MPLGAVGTGPSLPVCSLVRLYSATAGPPACANPSHSHTTARFMSGVTAGLGRSSTTPHAASASLIHQSPASPCTRHVSVLHVSHAILTLQLQRFRAYGVATGHQNCPAPAAPRARPPMSNSSLSPSDDSFTAHPQDPLICTDLPNTHTHSVKPRTLHMISSTPLTQPSRAHVPRVVSTGHARNVPCAHVVP